MFSATCTMQVPFMPDKLTMLETGRLYHPVPFDEYGLVASALAIELGKSMEFGEVDTTFHWQGGSHPVNADAAKLGGRPVS